MGDLDVLDRQQDIVLKRLYARRMLGGLAAQIAVADAVFVAYAWAGKSWDVPPDAMQVWLGATVVEVVSVVLVITRYLFPSSASEVRVSPELDSSGG
jgi:hypothetical protein